MPRIGTVISDVYRRPGADALPGHLERRYGITVRAMTTLAPGVYKIDRGDGPPWVARAQLLTRPAERTEADAEILRFLARSDVPAERCAHPEPVSDLNGRAILVTEFVTGDRWPGSAAGMRALGSALGRLHSLPAEPGPARRPAGSLHHLPAYEGGPEQDLAAAAAMLADLEGRVPAEHEQTYAALLGLLPRGDDCSGLPAAFAHPDPVPVNAISARGEPVLIDWTGAGTGPRLASLAMLVHSAGPRRAAAVMAGYSACQQLTPDELDRVEGVLWIRALWLAAWQCWLAAVTGRVRRPGVPDASGIAALAAALRETAR